MSFDSLAFLVFFPTVTILYFSLSHKYRVFMLLAASCIFYMFFIPAYILVLFALILVDFFAAIAIEKSKKTKTKSSLLILSIVSLCLTLFVFKYFNFININFANLANFFGANVTPFLLFIALPIGLSFHTFQSLSYVVEVYRGNQKAEKNIWYYALYVMFYPQLVAGPIERPQNLLHQFHEEKVFDYDRVRHGLERMLWGFFKKVVVAGRLGLIVDTVFANPANFSSAALLIGAILFTFQIYYDFSAYCDIALGAAEVMGIKLMENFNRPFAARTMTEFWHRWHISLSTWFRDYVYYPMVRKLGSTTRTKIYFATIVTFLITGFWHGANWTFGIFGLLHGSYLVIGTATSKWRRQLRQNIGLHHFPYIEKALAHITVFALAAIALIFFRSPDIGTGWYILSHIFLPSHMPFGISIKQLFLSVALIFILENVQYLGREKDIFARFRILPKSVRWSVYYAVIFAVITLSESLSAQFIYFQF